MNCPGCRCPFYCSVCSPSFETGFTPRAYKLPGCFLCKSKHESQVSGLNQGLKDVRDSCEKQGNELCLSRQQVNLLSQSLKQLQEQLSQSLKQAQEQRNKLAFLSMKDGDPSNQLFVGDVALIVEGSKRIEAHRLILAWRSPIFQKMFEHDMKEKLTGSVMIDDATFSVMQAVVRFCYTADISFTDGVDPAQVLQVAHKYEIPLLVDKCAEELCKMVNHNNLAQLLVLSKNCDVTSLQKTATAYLKENFDVLFWDTFKQATSNI